MSETGAQVNGPSGSGRFIDGVDPDDPAYIKNLQRPAEVKEDLHQMENRSRVKMVLSSEAFRDELEEIIQEHLQCGPYPETLIALKQITDLLAPSSRGSFGNIGRGAGSVIPINDLRGVEASGFTKGEKLLRCKLAALYRIVDLCGWSHGIYNHVSARVSADQEHFLINPFGMLYSEVTASSLVKVDVNGSVVEQGSSQLGVNKAGFTLHSAIHQARPDIKCIVHLHTPAAAAVSAMKCGLLPMSQEAMIIGNVSYHDYKGILVDAAEREQLARNLGVHNKVMFLRNHGIVACGETVEEAFHNVFNVMAACDTQVKAIPAGIDNIILPSEEVRQQVFKVGNKGGGGADTSSRKWKTGEMEFEALMRSMDNSGYRTGYLYKMPMVKQEKKDRSNSEVEIPPTSSSFSYMFDGDENSKYTSPLKAAMERQKKAYKAGWLTTPNAYKKTEVEEIGTTTPKKITKWVSDENSPNRPGGTPMKLDNPNQFAPQGTNPKEFKQKQKSLKKDYYEERVSAGPQSKILDGMSWDEAQKAKDGQLSGAGDQLIVVGAASKGIIKRDHQHNAAIYRQYYAANPFENMSEAEIEKYQKDVQRKEAGEPEVEEVQLEPPQPVVIEDSNRKPPVQPEPEKIEPEGQDAHLARLADKVVQTVIRDALAVARQGKGQQTLTGDSCLDAHLSNQCVMGGQTVQMKNPNLNASSDSRGRERNKLNDSFTGNIDDNNTFQNYTPTLSFEQEISRSRIRKAQQANKNENSSSTSENKYSDDEYVMIQVNPIHLYHGQTQGRMKIKFSIQSTVRRRIRAEMGMGSSIEEIYAAVTDPVIHHYKNDSAEYEAEPEELLEKGVHSANTREDNQYEYSPCFISREQPDYDEQFEGIEESEACSNNMQSIPKVLPTTQDDKKRHEKCVKGADSPNDDGDGDRDCQTKGLRKTDSPSDDKDKHEKSSKSVDSPYDVLAQNKTTIPEICESQYKSAKGNIKKIKDAPVVSKDSVAQSSSGAKHYTKKKSPSSKKKAKSKEIKAPLTPVQEYFEGTVEEMEEFETNLENADDSFERLLVTAEDSLLSCGHSDHDVTSSTVLDLNEFVGLAPLALNENEQVDHLESIIDSLQISKKKQTPPSQEIGYNNKSVENESDGLKYTKTIQIHENKCGNGNKKAPLKTSDDIFMSDEKPVIFAKGTLENRNPDTASKERKGTKGFAEIKEKQKIECRATSGQSIPAQAEMKSFSERAINDNVSMVAPKKAQEVTEIRSSTNKDQQRPTSANSSAELLFLDAFEEIPSDDDISAMIFSDAIDDVSGKPQDEISPFGKNSDKVSAISDNQDHIPFADEDEDVYDHQLFTISRAYKSESAPVNLTEPELVIDESTIAGKTEAIIAESKFTKRNEDGTQKPIIVKKNDGGAEEVTVRKTMSVIDEPIVENTRTVSDEPAITKNEKTRINEPRFVKDTQTVIDQQRPIKNTDTVIGKSRRIKSNETFIGEPKPAKNTEMVIDEPKPAKNTEMVIDEPKPNKSNETIIDEPKPNKNTEIVIDEPKPNKSNETIIDEPKPNKNTEMVIDEPKPNKSNETFIGEPKPNKNTEIVIDEPKPAKNTEMVIDEPKPNKSNETIIDEPRPVKNIETVIDEPRPVRNIETVIDEPRPVRNIETVIDEPRPDRNVETVIDEPRPVRNIETVIDEPRPVRNIETVIDEPRPDRNVETVIDEPRPVRNVETVIDEPRPVRNIETVIDEPRPVRNVETVIDEPRPVRNVETVIDEPRPVRNVETVIDEPRPVRNVETVIDEPRPVRNVETVIDEPRPVRNVETVIDEPRPVRNVETVIDEPRPVRNVETVIDEPRPVRNVETVIDEPAIAKNVETGIHKPRHAKISETVIDEPATAKITETIIDEPATTKIIETIIDEPATVKIIETVIDEPATTKIIETVIDEPATAKIIETIIDEPATAKIIETVIDDPGIDRKMKTVPKYPAIAKKETFIDDPVPDKKIETSFEGETATFKKKDTDTQKIESDIDCLYTEEENVLDTTPEVEREPAYFDTIVNNDNRTYQHSSRGRHFETVVDDFFNKKKNENDSYLPVIHKMTAIDDIIKQRDEDDAIIDDLLPSKIETFIDDIIPPKKMETTFYDIVSGKTNEGGDDNGHRVNEYYESDVIEESPNQMESDTYKDHSGDGQQSLNPPLNLVLNQGEQSDHEVNVDEWQGQDSAYNSSKSVLDELHLRKHNELMELSSAKSFFNPPVITVYPVTECQRSPTESLPPLPDTIDVPSVSDDDDHANREVRGIVQKPRVHAVSPPQVPQEKSKWKPKSRRERSSQLDRNRDYVSSTERIEPSRNYLESKSSSKPLSDKNKEAFQKPNPEEKSHQHTGGRSGVSSGRSKRPPADRSTSRSVNDGYARSERDRDERKSNEAVEKDGKESYNRRYENSSRSKNDERRQSGDKHDEDKDKYNDRQSRRRRSDRVREDEDRRRKEKGTDSGGRGKSEEYARKPKYDYERSSDFENHNERERSKGSSRRDRRRQSELPDDQHDQRKDKRSRTRDASDNESERISLKKDEALTFKYDERNQDYHRQRHRRPKEDILSKTEKPYQKEDYKSSKSEAGIDFSNRPDPNDEGQTYNTGPEEDHWSGGAANDSAKERDPIDKFLNSPRFEVDVEKSPRLQRRRGGAIAKEGKDKKSETKTLSPSKTRLMPSVSSEHLLSPSTLPRRHKSSTSLVSSVRSRSGSPRAFRFPGDPSSQQLDSTGKPYNFYHPLMLSMENLHSGSDVSFRMLRAKSEASLLAVRLDLGRSHDASEEEGLFGNQETDAKELEIPDDVKREQRDSKQGVKLRKDILKEKREFGIESNKPEDTEGRKDHRRRAGERNDDEFVMQKERSRQSERESKQDCEDKRTEEIRKDGGKPKRESDIDSERNDWHPSNRKQGRRSRRKYDTEPYEKAGLSSDEDFADKKPREEPEKGSRSRHNKARRKIGVDETNMRRESLPLDEMENHDRGSEKKTSRRKDKKVHDKNIGDEPKMNDSLKDFEPSLFFNPGTSEMNKRDFDDDDDLIPQPKKGFLSKLSCVGSRSSDAAKKKHTTASKPPIQKDDPPDQKKKNLDYYEEGERRKTKKLSKDKQKEDKTGFYFQHEGGDSDPDAIEPHVLKREHHEKDVILPDQNRDESYPPKRGYHEKKDVYQEPKSLTSFSANSVGNEDYRDIFKQQKKEKANHSDTNENTHRRASEKHDEAKESRQRSRAKRPTHGMDKSHKAGETALHEFSSHSKPADDEKYFEGKTWEPRARRDKQSNLKARPSKSLERHTVDEATGLLGEDVITSSLDAKHDGATDLSAPFYQQELDSYVGKVRHDLVSEHVDETPCDHNELFYFKRHERKLSFDGSILPFSMDSPPKSGDSSPVRRRISQVSLGTGSSMTRPRSASTVSNPLTYQPWRSKTRRRSRSMSISEMVYASGVPRPRSRSNSVGEILFNSPVASSVARRRSRSSSVTEITSRMYQPRLRSRSRGSLGDTSLGSVAPFRQRKYSGSPSFPAEKRAVSAAPVKRSDSERHPSKSPELIEELDRKSKTRGQSERRPKGHSREELGDDKPVSPSKSDTLKSTDSASGGETLEEHSSKEGSPTKEHPAAAKDKKKKKKFRIPSFSKKKNKESKESSI